MKIKLFVLSVATIWLEDKTQGMDPISMDVVITRIVLLLEGSIRKLSLNFDDFNLYKKRQFVSFYYISLSLFKTFLFFIKKIVERLIKT